MRRHGSLSRKQLSALSLAIATSTVPALGQAVNVVSTWTNAAGGSTWSTTGNWSPSGTPNNTVATTFDVVIGAPSPTNVNGSFAIDSITIGAANLVNILQGQTLTLNGPTLTNNGTILVDSNPTGNATTLNFTGGTLSGSGSVVLNAAAAAAQVAGTLTLASTSTISGIGQIAAAITNLGLVNANSTIGSLNIATANFTNDTILEATGGGVLGINSAAVVTQPAGGQVLANTASVVNLNGGSIFGGTLNNSGTGIIQVTAASTIGTLTNLGTIDVPQTEQLNVSGNVTNNGTILVDSNPASGNALLSFNGGTLSGSGSVVLNGNTVQAQVTGTLTLASTISGYGQITAGFTNIGTVNANSTLGSLNLNGPKLTNNGLLESTGAGTLQIDGIITQGAGGQISAGTASLVSVSGTILGGAVNAASAAFVNLSTGGTLSGVTLTTSSGGVVQVSSGTGTFIGVTTGGVVNVPQSTTLNIAGVVTNNGTITVNSNPSGGAASLNGAGGTLSGSGTVVLNAKTTQALISGTLTQASASTILGLGQIMAALTNNGTVDASTTAGPLNVNTANFTNNSLLEATSGGTLNLNAGTVVTQGSGGQVTASGAPGIPGVLNLNGGSILGGALNNSGSGIIEVIAPSTLGNVTNLGVINVLQNQQLNITGNLTNNGTILVDLAASNNPAILKFNGGTLSGSGAVVLNASSTQAQITGTLTLAPAATIAGFGQITAAVANNGIVNANSTLGALNLQTAPTNNGVLEATGGGTLNLNSLTLNQGTGQVTVGTQGSVVNVVSSVIVGQSVTTSPGGTLTFTGVGDGVPGSISNAGAIAANAPLTTVGQITGNGAISVASNDTLRLSGLSEPSTAGSIVLTNSTLDITNNKLVIAYPSPAVDPITSIAADLTQGYNGGNWQGLGITSSTAAANQPKFALGYLDGDRPIDSSASAVTANQIVIQYTLTGDAFLENSIGFDDLVIVAQDFGTTGQDWAAGNFNYDPAGSVGFADLVSVAQNFGQATGLSEGDRGTGLSPAWQVATAVLPEPASAALLAMAAAGLLAQRRRRSA